MSRKIAVSIIGSGVVGTATGKGLAKIGHPVIFFDVDEDKINNLRLEGCEVTRSLSDAISSSSLSFVCVQTPTVDGTADLSFLKDAIASVSKAVQEKNKQHLIVVRSTLIPGTMKREVVSLVRRHCNAGICYNPEFLREEHALEDFLNPSRIVIGEEDSVHGDLLAEVYSSFNAPIIRTNFETAEMIKHVSNAFLATKISFFNEIFLVCTKLKIDSQIVSEAVSLDPRIGKYGVYGGRHFSGGCLPKDVTAFATFVGKLGINPDIIEKVLDINSHIRRDLLKAKEPDKM